MMLQTRILRGRDWRSEGSGLRSSPVSDAAGSPRKSDLANIPSDVRIRPLNPQTKSGRSCRRRRTTIPSPTTANSENC
jgi:hypothetical protein